MIATLVLCALASLASGGEEAPDLLTLKDGMQLECRVLYEDEGKVIYRAKRKDTEVPRSEVAEIQSLERSLRTFLERFAQCDRADARALAELAQFAESRFLPAEAHDLWIRILTVDPEHEQAWTKLGGVKGRKGWQLKVRGRFYSLEELRERVGDWKNALELPTAHFLIRTDAAPERALDLAIDVERMYLAFYDLLAPHLGLYSAWEETPEIHVFRDAKDAPAPPTPGRNAWFAVGENTLYVHAVEERGSHEALAEFVDLLLLNSFRRTLDKRTGTIAPWAREGLRQAFAAGVRPAPGRVTFDLASPITAYFQDHARDPKPLGLEKLLNAGFGAFDTGSDAPRYVAQGYTLTHFLAFGAEQKYRPGLARFLLSSFEGQGAATHLKKILDVDLGQLEEEWNAYVKGVAGS
jgi:hypothetical protein